MKKQSVTSKLYNFERRLKRMEHDKKQKIREISVYHTENEKNDIKDSNSRYYTEIYLIGDILSDLQRIINE